MVKCILMLADWYADGPHVPSTETPKQLIVPLRRLSRPETGLVRCPSHACPIFQGVQGVAPQLLTLVTQSVRNNRFGWQTLGQTCSRGDPGSAICVQRLDDSLNSAIHTRYRSLLRSSSMHEPRDPPSEVVNFASTYAHTKIIQVAKV